MDLKGSASTANAEERTALRRREVALHRGRSVGAEGGAGVEKTRLDEEKREGWYRSTLNFLSLPTCEQVHLYLKGAVVGR